MISPLNLFVWGLYISEEEKKKAELVVRPLVFVRPEAGGNGPTPGLKKEGDARGARIFMKNYTPKPTGAHRQSSYSQRSANWQKCGFRMAVN